MNKIQKSDRTEGTKNIKMPSLSYCARCLWRLCNRTYN